MTSDELAPKTSHDAVHLEPRLLAAVLFVGDFGENVDVYRRALEERGARVSQVRRLAELERWPRGHIIVCGAAHATPWWRSVGATHIVVFADDVSRAPHADHVLPPGASAERLIAVMLACR